MPFATTWIVLEIIILSEVSQTEKYKYHMISPICGTLKKMIQMNLFAKQKKETHRLREWTFLLSLRIKQPLTFALMWDDLELNAQVPHSPSLCLWEILPTASICSPEELKRDVEEVTHANTVLMGVPHTFLTNWVGWRLLWLQSWFLCLIHRTSKSSVIEWALLHLTISRPYFLFSCLPLAGSNDLPIYRFSHALLRQEGFKKPGALDLFTVMRSLILNVLKGYV